MVSVTVEGSVGPVKAMVRLGDSVGEAIATVLERYAREGRSPRLDPAASESFQLHHSHFSLHSKPTAWYHFFFLEGHAGDRILWFVLLWLLVRCWSAIVHVASSNHPNGCGAYKVHNMVSDLVF